MPNSCEQDTGPFEAVPARENAAWQPVVQADLAGMSHIGNVRTNNEDHFLIIRFGRFLESLQTNLPLGDVPGRSEVTGYGMVVADGVGGHASGEVASRSAISMMVGLVCETPDWILLVEQEPFSEEVIRRARERYQRVDTLLTERGERDASLAGYGTTLTMAWSVGRDLFVANLGDSPAYLLRENHLGQLTRDHTVAQGLVDLGILAQEDVATHRLRHVLTRSLGPASLESSPDIRRFSLEDGDCLLLCTDGLKEMVPDARIQEILASNQPAAQACQRLVDAALQAGGKDNVTVIVARYRLS
jgi:protein phosphatase